MFQFDSFDAFLAMAGHGPYVWAAYGVSLTIMAWLALSPLRRQRALLGELRRRLQTQRPRGES
ncbi:heme exporter protein CcmD [Gammaproteobacteria bacterium 53_120_T64]|nr:heme exporter protein CcmD [Gammaproteobacteria bacterium 53_120_T64]